MSTAGVVDPGQAVGPIRHRLDFRWTMNYAASVEDQNPRLYDPLGPVHAGYVAHMEWLVRQQIREQPSLAGASGIVQLGTTTRLTRPLRPDESVVICGGVAASTQKSAGAVVVTWFDVRADAGESSPSELLVRTAATSLYRGIEVTEFGEVSRAPSVAWSPTERIPVRFGLHAAHVYSECARIWVPLHTDLRASRAAGYDRLMLHGTATLSYCLSALVDRFAEGDHSRVTDYSCSFVSPVFVGSDAHLELAAQPSREGLLARFRLTDRAGRRLLDDGELRLRETPVGWPPNAPADSLGSEPWWSPDAP